MKMRVWYSATLSESTKYYFYPIRKSSKMRLLGLLFTNNAKAFGFTWWTRKNFLESFNKVDHFRQNDFNHWAIKEAFEDVETQYGLKALSNE